MKTRKIDACISYFGKPYQTIVTIFSLLEHNAEYIDKIYLIVDKRQPYPDAWEGVAKIQSLFKDKGLIVHHAIYFMPFMVDKDPYILTERQRKSIRYQFGLEATDKPFILLLHNDMLFQGKIVDKLLDVYEKANDDRLAGVGPIGQCWNCEASNAGLCDSLIFPNYVPTQEEAIELYTVNSTPRGERGLRAIKKGKVFPLPECRLNEHLCLINTKIYREATLPNGSAPYFGGVWDGSDTAVAWFYHMVNSKYTFKHFYYEPLAIHAPFSSTKNGTEADTKREIYNDIETQAYRYMREHYFSKTFNLPTIIKGLALKFRRILYW